MVWLKGQGKEPSELVNGFDRQATHFFCPEHGYVNKRGSPLAYRALWGLKSKENPAQSKQEIYKGTGSQDSCTKDVAWA